MVWLICWLMGPNRPLTTIIARNLLLSWKRTSGSSANPVTTASVVLEDWIFICAETKPVVRFMRQVWIQLMPCPHSVVLLRLSIIWQAQPRWVVRLVQRTSHREAQDSDDDDFGVCDNEPIASRVLRSKSALVPSKAAASKYRGCCNDNARCGVCKW